MLTVTIDWLSINFKELTHEAEYFMRTYARFPDTQDTAPRFGYASATVDGNGTVTMWNTDRQDMGTHVIFSGSALRNLFQRSEVQPSALLRAVSHARGIVSRLDLAKDLTGQAVDYEAIYQQIKRGDCTGTARTARRIEETSGGITIYVGSRQSEKYLRLYDKAAQSLLVGERWARLECETKGMVARAVLTSLNHTQDWAAVFDTIVMGMVDLPDNADWGQFFPTGKVDIGLPKLEKQTDREKWISEQVIAAVARHYIDNPTSEAVTRLIETLNLIDRQRKA